MASVKVTGSADELRSALTIYGTVADEFESGGTPIEELRPRLLTAEQHIDEWWAHVRQRIRQAADA